MQKEHADAERASVFSNVFLNVLKTHVLRRVIEDIKAEDPTVLVVEGSAHLKPEGERLRFTVRAVCFSDLSSHLINRLSQEILEEFSLPGFRIDILTSSPVSPI